MDKSIVAAFSEASRRTFSEMFGLDAELSASRELAPAEDHGWNLSGLIGIAGAMQGIVALRLTDELGARLLEGTGVASRDDEERSELVGGLVGELCNILAGSVSSTGGFDFDIAPPVVIRGPHHRIGWPSIAPVIALEFATASGRFEVDVCIRG